MVEDKRLSKELTGKIIVSKSGKKFGVLGDMVFETRTGELVYVLLKQPTAHANTLELEKDRSGGLLIPFSSVMSIGDFIIINEDDMV